MTSRRWFALPAALGPTSRPAVAVVGLGAFVTLTILSGHSVGIRTAADSRPATLKRPASVTVTLPDVVGALQVFGRPPAAPRANRSQHRGQLTVRPAHRWVRPYGGVFSSPFGYRWGRLHAGIDLAGPWGSTFVAATDGCIEYAGPQSGYGEVMRIRDWDGTETVYGHMSSFIRRSGCVHAGDPIARVGTAGDATGPHLHFEVRVGGVPIDPVPFLAKRGVYV
jgi:murein DD-endopeptidase MepM/ murein hydrolase activator NlpD